MSRQFVILIIFVFLINGIINYHLFSRTIFPAVFKKSSPDGA